jgi:hypothetical protein
VLCIWWVKVIADIDGDGIDEMVVGASYFYDREYYEDPEYAKELNGLDIGKYVGGSIVVFNLETKQVKWVADLDLSTDSVSYRAYIYSSPTVVDLDNDGKMEILIGTSFGLLYVLHHDGNYFPPDLLQLQLANDGSLQEHIILFLCQNLPISWFQKTGHRRQWFRFRFAVSKMVVCKVLYLYLLI